MAVLISLGGNPTGDGFLIAPLGTTYDAELTLSTDTGTLASTLQASPNPAGLVFSQTSVNLSTTPTVVTVHAMAQSSARGDTTIQVLDGATVVASFTLTSIKHPFVNFRGRFEARFATDGALYNRNPIYTATLDAVVPPGWTWGLEGEPDFVPAVGNVPENLETPVGRAIRLNNPVSLRSQAAAVVSTVTSISGQTTSGTETFTTGDPLIGQPVNFGPNTYYAGNNAFGAPAPEEYYDAAKEPLGLFEIHFGSLFSGGSQIGPFTHKATFVNEQTRTPDSRPIANGLIGAAADLAEFGLPNLATFSETRINLLLTEWAGLPAGDSPQRRNLVRRIGHLLSSVSAAKRNQVQTDHPGVFTVRAGTLPQGWPNKEIYQGEVDANLVFNPGGSAMVTYMSEFPLFLYESHMFGFHSDELCGHHKGTLKPHRIVNGTYTGDPHVHTVDGTLYDFQAVGEFTLLRDGDEFEVQVRQWPIATNNPITDPYSGITSCVSLTVAVAARVGRHSIAFQPGKERQRLEFFLDGKRTQLPFEGLDLDGHRVSAFDASGETGLRVDYLSGAVVVVTPMFWNAYQVWYLNTSISNTQADEGIMGIIPQKSWLPRLRDGDSFGAMPASLSDRYDELYGKFAESWRVDDSTSLFVYQAGESTKTFTDREWPAKDTGCKLKPEFQIPGAPVLEGMPEDQAEKLCAAVTEKDLHQFCVFDVAATGDETFVKGYLLAQELRLYGTSVVIERHEAPTRATRLPEFPTDDRPTRNDQSLLITAKVVPLTPGRPTPSGSITFVVDGVPQNRPTPLDERGRAQITVNPVAVNTRELRGKRGRRRTVTATYSGGGKYNYHSGSSSNLNFTETPTRNDDKRR